MTSHTETIDVRGGRFHVQLQRAGAGEPLLYLHGIEAEDGWPEFLGLLAQRFDVIAPVHPGWGDSTGLEHIDDMVDLALFYFDFLDALGIESVHLAGHSLGGMLAAEMAAFDASYARTLTLIAPAGLWLDESPPLDIFVAGREEIDRATYFEPSRASALRPRSEDAAELARQDLERRKALAAAGKFIWPIWDKGLKKRLHRVKSPTLIVWGERDDVIPAAYGEEFRRLIAVSRLETIPETGHVPMIERPRAFVNAVSGFIDSVR